MSRGIPTFNYIRAIQIMYGEWYSVNHCDYIPKGHEALKYKHECVLRSHELSAEQKLLKQEAWESLSEEAKEVILIIISSPAELLEIFKTPQRGLFSKRSIRKHFRKVWHSKFISDLTIKEITKWVNQL